MNSLGARQLVFVPTRTSSGLVGPEASAVIPLIDRDPGPTTTNTLITVNRQASNISSTLRTLHRGHGQWQRETPMESTGTRLTAVFWIRSTRYAATVRRTIGKKTSYICDPTKRTLSSPVRGCLVDSLYRYA